MDVTYNTSRKLSCTTCQASTTSLEDQRKHTQTDWHVYNLKRRIATLAPLSLQVFNEEVCLVQPVTGAVRPESNTCRECQKTFYSLKSWDKHCKMPSHGRKIKELLEDTRTAKGSDDSVPGHVTTETDTFEPTVCIFCRIQSSSLSLNVEHMQLGHGLFIPDQERVTDIGTFLLYLFTIITDLNECLYCGCAKRTTEAIRSHMVDRGHCMLNFDLESELKMFWEQDSDDEAVSGSQLTKISLAAAQDSTSNRKRSLRLLSNKVLAHRFQRNPSQQQRPRPSVTQQVITNGLASSGISQDPRTRKQVVTCAHGSSGLIGVSQLQRRALMAVDIANKKVQTQARNKYARNLDKSTNMTAQKHFKFDADDGRLHP